MNVSRVLSVLVALVWATAQGRADDLDILVAPDSTVEQRGAAYDRLAQGDFPSFAGRLAALIGAHPVLTGIGPRTKTPWREEQLVPSDRIGCTLWQLWGVHLPPVAERGLVGGDLLLECERIEVTGEFGEMCFGEFIEVWRGHEAVVRGLRVVVGLVVLRTDLGLPDKLQRRAEEVVEQRPDLVELVDRGEQSGVFQPVVAQQQAHVRVVLLFQTGYRTAYALYSPA